MVGLDHRGFNVNEVPQEEDIGCPLQLPVIYQVQGEKILKQSVQVKANSRTASLPSMILRENIRSCSADRVAW